MTFPRLLKLLLMACVSFNRAPSDLDSFNLSLPAKSMRFNVPEKIIDIPHFSTFVISNTKPSMQ